MTLQRSQVYTLTIDLARDKIVKPQGEEIPFKSKSFASIAFNGLTTSVGLAASRQDQAFEVVSVLQPSLQTHTLAHAVNLIF
jgi:hypothetical protein